MARFNLMYETEIAMDFEIRNEIMIAMFGDDYPGNRIQEGLMEEQARQAYWLGSNYRNPGMRSK